MARFPQRRGQRGSQKWLQLAVEHDCSSLNAPIAQRLGVAEADLDWRSPLAEDDFAEYRDQTFLTRLGAVLPHRTLASFWPSRGPQWDGLGRTRRGDMLLVEAKAHIPEMCSSGSAAKSASLSKIQAALRETQIYLSISTDNDWCATYYQYANRLAHLYLLRTLNFLPAWLVLVHFVGDEEMGGPSSREEWENTIAMTHEKLGLPIGHSLASYLIDVFIDVRSVEAACMQRSSGS